MICHVLPYGVIKNNNKVARMAQFILGLP